MHSMRMNTGYSTVRIAQILGVNEEVVRSLLEVGGTPKLEEARISVSNGSASESTVFTVSVVQH